MSYQLIICCHILLSRRAPIHGQPILCAFQSQLNSEVNSQEVTKYSILVSWNQWLLRTIWQKVKFYMLQLAVVDHMYAQHPQPSASTELCISIQQHHLHHIILPAYPRSCWLNGTPKSREILMFVCLQKEAKQCCDATKLGCTHWAGLSHLVTKI